MREFLKQYLTEKQNGYLESGRLQDVVAYERWSLWESWLYVEALPQCLSDRRLRSDYPTEENIGCKNKLIAVEKSDLI